MEIKHKFYAVQEKNKEGSPVDCVRLVVTGNKVDDSCKALGYVATIYGKLSKTKRDDFQSKNGYLKVIDNKGIVVAHLWDCYTYEQYKKVYNNK